MIMKDEILPKLSNLQSSPIETIWEVFGQPRVCYIIISRERLFKTKYVDREKHKTKYAHTHAIKYQRSIEAAA